MVKTAYIWDNIVVGTRELEEYLNDGYRLVSSALYEDGDELQSELIFAAVLVKDAVPKISCGNNDYAEVN